MKYVCEKWGLQHLTERDRNANSIGSVLDFNGPLRTDVPISIPSPIPAPVPTPESAPSVLNHEQALLSFARYLDAATLHPKEEIENAYDRLKREYQGSLEDKIEVAKERFKHFLSGTKTHMKGITRDGSKQS